MYICMYTYHNIIWKESQVLKHEQHFFFKIWNSFVIIIRILTGEMKVMNIHENDKVQLVNNINVSFRRCFGIDTYKWIFC